MLLGINVDNKQTFKSHVETLRKKAAQRLHALARIANYMETEQLASLMNTFIMSHFSYSPLAWMFRDRNMIKKTIGYKIGLYAFSHEKTPYNIG